MGTRDLSTTSVFFDFDGTISTTDVGVHVLEQLADPSWRRYEDDYTAGRIGSRECMAKQWACIPDHVGEQQRRAAAQEVPLDPGFGPLVDALRAGGAEVAVVSDGYGFYVHERLAAWDLPVFTNDVDFATNTVVWPHDNAGCGLCAACGTCKPSFLEEAHRRGRRSLFIGDGASDRYAARVADEVFATGALARWCTEEGVTHVKFENLSEVNRLVFP